MSEDTPTPAQNPDTDVSQGVEAKDSVISEDTAEKIDSAVEPSLAVDNEARLLQLEQEHSALRKEHETLKSQYVRIAADFDNFRKRQSRDQDDLRLQLTCSTLGEILPVIDNFERASQQLEPQGEEAQAIHRSYQGLYKQFVDVLKQLGVAPMRVIGQTFDPNLHEAVLREPSDLQSEDVITEELQRGYHLNGRVLRHALVKVSMGPGPKTTSDSVDHSVDEVKTSESDASDVQASQEAD